MLRANRPSTNRKHTLQLLTQSQSQSEFQSQSQSSSHRPVSPVPEYQSRTRNRPLSDLKPTLVCLLFTIYRTHFVSWLLQQRLSKYWAQIRIRIQKHTHTHIHIHMGTYLDTYTRIFSPTLSYITKAIRVAQSKNVKLFFSVFLFFLFLYSAFSFISFCVSCLVSAVYSVARAAVCFGGRRATESPTHI